MTNTNDREALGYDEDTLGKVYEALGEAGIEACQAQDAVNLMQNRGILFREHLGTPATQPTTDATVTDAVRYYAESWRFKGKGEPDECEQAIDWCSQTLFALLARLAEDAPLGAECKNTGWLITGATCLHCKGSGRADSIQGAAECQWCGGCGHVCDDSATRPTASEPTDWYSYEEAVAMLEFHGVDAERIEGDARRIAGFHRTPTPHVVTTVEDPIPRYAQLDIWMALYGPERSQEYDSYRDEHGFASTWADLCADVRRRCATTPHVVTTVALSSGEDVGASLDACVVCGSDDVAHQGVVHASGRVMVVSWCASKECDDDRRLSYPSGMLPATVLTPATQPTASEPTDAQVEAATLALFIHSNTDSEGDPPTYDMDDDDRRYLEPAARAALEAAAKVGGDA